MDFGLVVGTALAGAVVGVLVDDVAARVRPARSAGAATTAGTATPTGATPATPTGATPMTGPPQVSERLVAAAVGAVLLGGAADHLGPVPVLAAYCVLFAGLLAMSIADVRVGLVPRRFVYATAVLVAAGLVGASAEAGRWHPLVDAVIGGAIAFAALYVVWWLFPRGLGFGDVRLAALFGAGLGWFGLLHVYLGFVVAFVAGAALGLGLMLARGTGRRTRLPFAPALALGVVVGVLWGTPMINLWLPGHG